jgi:hypothetical protein
MKSRWDQRGAVLSVALNKGVDFGYRTAHISGTRIFKGSSFGRIGGKLQYSPNSITASHFSRFSISLRWKNFKSVRDKARRLY